MSNDKLFEIHLDEIIDVYRREGYTISREEAISISEAIDFAYDTWVKSN